MEGEAASLTVFLASLGDPQLILTGAAGGGIGSFLRESAWLYSELHSRRENRFRFLLFLPLWVLCGALFGGALAAQYEITLFYALLAGGIWRPVISNSRLALKVISSVIEELQKDGKEESP